MEKRPTRRVSLRPSKGRCTLSVDIGKVVCNSGIHHGFVVRRVSPYRLGDVLLEQNWVLLLLFDILVFVASTVAAEVSVMSCMERVSDLPGTEERRLLSHSRLLSEGDVGAIRREVGLESTMLSDGARERLVSMNDL